MAGAVNITIGAVVGPFVAGIRQAQAVTGGFTAAFKQQFDGLKATAEAPKGAFAELTRTLSATRRQIQDVIAAGGRVPPELTARFSLLQGAVNGVNSAFAQTPSRLDAIAATGAKLQSVGQNLSTFLTLPLLGAGAAAFKTFADLDALKRGLENVEGSAAGANARFAELREVARLPGLGLEEAVQGDVRLRAVGFSATQSKNALLQFGNALALTGGGKFELNSILTQLTQMGSKAKVLSEDLKPILPSSPAVAKAIKELFGTVDSEQISAKLQAAGKGPQDFINILVAKLSTLTRVAGGPKNALENLGDSLKIASYEFGQAADKSLSLTDKLTRLGDFIGSLATGFAGLGPTTQSLILGLFGAAAAAGPLLFSIGAISQLLPTFAKGFGLLKAGFSSVAAIGPLLAGISLPVLAIGAAVAVTAGLVIFYWKDIKKYLTDTGIWSAASDAARSAMDFLRAIFDDVGNGIREKWGMIREAFSAGVAFISAIWQRFGPVLTDVAKTVFGQVATIFKGAFSVLSQLFQGFTALLKGDWQGFGKALVNIGILFTNTLTSLIVGTVSGIIRLTAGLFDAFGADELATKIRGYASTVTGIGEKLKFSLFETRKEAEKTTAVLSKTPASARVTASPRAIVAPPTAAPGIDFSAVGGDSSIETAKKRLKDLKDQIQSLKVTGKAVPKELQTEYSQLAQTIKKATDATKLPKIPKEVTNSYREPVTALKFWQSTMERLRAEVAQLQANGRPVSDQTFRQLEAATAKYDELKTAVDLLSERKPIELKVRVTQTGEVTDRLAFRGQASDLGGKPAKFKPPTGPSQKEIDDSASRIVKPTDLDLFNPQKLGLQLKLFSDFSTKLTDQMRQLGDSIGGALKDAAVQGLVGMGELIGGLIAGTAQLSDLPKLIGGIFASLASTMGQALIAFGTAGIAAKAFISNPVTAIIAGVALVALGAGLKASLQKSAGKGLSARPFATGGLVFGPTLGLIGEGLGTTRTNPEVVAPLDKLKNFIKPAGGESMAFIPNVTLRGSDLIIAFDRAKKAKNY